MAFNTNLKNLYFSSILLLCVIPIIFAENEVKWGVKFDPIMSTAKLSVNTDFEVTIYNVSSDILQSNAIICLLSSNTRNLKVSKIIPLHEFKNGTWKGSFTVRPVRLGEAFVYVEINRGNKLEIAYRVMRIIIERNVIDVDLDKLLFPQFTSIFIHTFYVILNMTFGAVFDLQNLKKILKKPHGIAIAFLISLCILPLVSFVLILFNLEKINCKYSRIKIFSFPLNNENHNLKYRWLLCLD